MDAGLPRDGWGMDSYKESERTNGQILEAAHGLILEKGLTGASRNDVANLYNQSLRGW